MSSTLIIHIILLILGVLLNIFIGKLAVLIFKKDGTLSRAPLRFLGIYLIINSISVIFNI